MGIICSHMYLSNAHACFVEYSHLSNKRGGDAKVAKSLNVVVGINVEDGILWKIPTMENTST